MKPSQKTLTPAAHIGLGMGTYVQATSPLRRYLDLVVHQQLRAFLRGEEVLDEQSVQQRIGATEAVSGNARWAERRSIEHWTLVFLLQNPDWHGRAVVIDKRGRHDRILVPELGLETNLFQRKNRHLDSEIQVAVNEVNLAFLEAHFKLSG
jgi:exoribonuclease-2